MYKRKSCLASATIWELTFRAACVLRITNAIESREQLYHEDCSGKLRRLRAQRADGLLGGREAVADDAVAGCVELVDGGHVEIGRSNGCAVVCCTPQQPRSRTATHHVGSSCHDGQHASSGHQACKRAVGAHLGAEGRVGACAAGSAAAWPCS
jgi:hypothetical protein